MYKLYTDKIENFEAKIKLEGASLKKSKARLVVEADGFDIMFKGVISESGQVKIPVKRLRGLIDESTEGTIRLEIIAEDTYFTPWESKFKVQQSKKVTVEVISQEKPILKKTKDTVHILSQPTLTEKEHILNLVKMLIKEDININNLTIRKNKLNNIVAEYIQENPIKEDIKLPVIEKVIKVLQKRK
jgi:hypothetical protein|tara:strand:+ start:1906 stop:2466 length:561 start_codon:yes stop_codon:yes gene_type:complete